MKRGRGGWTRRFPSTLALIALTISACRKPPAALRAPAAHVLFVGDSLISTNDLPRVFSGIAASRGDPVDVLVTAPGGANSTAQRALDDASFVHQKLPSEDWAFAVVQEHSELPIVSAPGHDVASSVLKLSRAIRENDPRTRLVYLETWGFKDGDATNCGYAPILCTYDGMQDGLLRAYAGMARDNSGLIAPAGEAWREVRRARPDIPLYADDHHPSPQGTYLTACVVYSILFKKRSLGADPQGLDPARAETLQATADAVVFDPKSDWSKLR
ncbi:MAG TPA: DUF4886 domain-containing protein [Elusimicrobiota bacterium]|nr:DUF4886 domain-containing protein [Elusimicrobiota bacterium]